MKYFIIAVVLFFSNTSFADPIEIMDSVVTVATIDRNNKAGFGSAFCVLETKREYIFLTAGHVVTHCLKECYVTGFKNGEKTKPITAKVIKFEFRDYRFFENRKDW